MGENIMIEIKNPRRTASTDIDCEIKHPVHGWIPFTASPDDTEQHGRDIFAQVSQRDDIAPHTSPPVKEILEEERENMRVKSYQAKIAMDDAGVLDNVEAIIENADKKTKIAYADADTWGRYSKTVLAMQAALGWTDEFVDDLFRAAAKVEA